GVIRSRVGLSAPADAVAAGDDLLERLAARPRPDVIVVDECQFLAEAQIDQLRAIVDLQNIPVLCFGLRTDFQTRLFPGSRRLFELADSITEIKTICACGAKATVNARIDPQGYILTEGAQVELGGNERYLAMCHRCYMTHIREHKKVRYRKERLPWQTIPPPTSTLPPATSAKPSSCPAIPSAPS